jgi:17beta-estradiol 17-dehydrogenase/3alpha(17beta)-hydroxysteroid dehydrogenase (NAD+)
MSISVNGKLALITGSASGIGLASARLLAKNGADLALCDINPKVTEIAAELQELYAGSSQKITAHLCDVTISKSVEEFFAAIKSAHGDKYFCPNIVINSAGIALNSPLTQVKEEDFDRILNINLKGTFLVTQAAVRLLIENFPNATFNSETDTYASIVNLASQAGKIGMPTCSHYAMTKAGVDGFTKSIGKELGAYRIRCNAVLPSFIDTPMVDLQGKNPAQVSLFKRMSALNRIGLPEEVAELILFLASDASSFMNCGSVDISGGF